MTRPIGRIAFAVVWMIVWTAAIFVAVAHFGEQALDGEIVAALFLVAWVGLALFALVRVARRTFDRAASPPERPRRRGARFRWRDGIDPPPPPPPSG